MYVCLSAKLGMYACTRVSVYIYCVVHDQRRTTLIPTPKMRRLMSPESRPAAFLWLFWPLLGLSSFASQEGSKEWKKAEAKVRRQVTPTRRSGKNLVSEDVLKRWNQKGEPRNELIRMMVQCKFCNDSGLKLFGVSCWTSLRFGSGLWVGYPGMLRSNGEPPSSMC